MADIEPIGQAWDALLDLSTCNRAFSCFTWFRESCRADPPQQLLVMGLRERKQLKGLLPMVVRQGQAVFPNHLADYQDIIVAKGDTQSAQKLLCHVQDLQMPFVLSHCRQDSTLVSALTEGPFERDFMDFENRKQCCHIRLPESFEAYLKTRSKAFRKQIRRAERKAQDAGLSVRPLDPTLLAPEKLPALFLDLHFRRFEETSCFHKEPFASFVVAALPLLYSQKRLLPMGLFRGDQIVGIDLYMLGPGTMGTWNAGYLEEVAPFSPGKLMLAGAIRTALSLGLKEVDMLRGAQKWKLSWANGIREMGCFEMQPHLADSAQRVINH